MCNLAACTAAHTYMIEAPRPHLAQVGSTSSECATSVRVKVRLGVRVRVRQPRTNKSETTRLRNGFFPTGVRPLN